MKNFVCLDMPPDNSNIQIEVTLDKVMLYLHLYDNQSKNEKKLPSIPWVVHDSHDQLCVIGCSHFI